MEKIINEYKNRLACHLLWADENKEEMTSTENMLFKLHLTTLEDFIKDLEGLGSKNKMKL